MKQNRCILLEQTYPGITRNDVVFAVAFVTVKCLKTSIVIIL